MQLLILLTPYTTSPCDVPMSICATIGLLQSEKSTWRGFGQRSRISLHFYRELPSEALHSMRETRHDPSGKYSAPRESCMSGLAKISLCCRNLNRFRNHEANPSDIRYRAA